MTCGCNVATFQRVVKTNVATLGTNVSREGLIQRRDVEIQRRDVEIQRCDVPEEGKTDVATLRHSDVATS